MKCQHTIMLKVITFSILSMHEFVEVKRVNFPGMIKRHTVIL